MNVVYALAGLIGVAGILFAVVNLIYPIKRLGIPTRKRASLVMAASIGLVIVAAALTESVKQPDSLASLQPPPNATTAPTDTDPPKETVPKPVTKAPAQPAPVTKAPPAEVPAVPPRNKPETKVAVAQPAVNVNELLCPEPVEVKLEYREAKVPVRRIAADIVEQWGLKAGPFTAIPEDAARTFYWVLSASSALSVLARGTSWTWYRDGNTVRFVNRNDPIMNDGLISNKFEIRADAADGGLTVSVESNLRDRQEIWVQIDRPYSETGNKETYSRSYGKHCGLAAQWRAPKFIPIDDEAWKADLIAHQDQMAQLGPDMAYEIGEIKDHVTINARSQWNKANASVLLPITVSIRSKSHFAGGDHLALLESYELLAEAPLIARISSPSERGRRLGIGEVFRVEGIEHSQLERWYLVAVTGQQGWINSIALLREGVKRVSSLTAYEGQIAEVHMHLMDNVFEPCLEFAYNKLVGGQDSNNHLARLAMFESVQPHVKELAAELIKIDVDLLSRSELQRFYQNSLENCKLGVGR